MSDTTSSFTKGIDVIAVGSIVGTIVGWLPTIAAVLSIIWFCIQISESHTFVHWKNNWLMRRKAAKIARLRAKEKILSAQIAAIETVRSAKVEAREKVATAKAEATLDVIHDTTSDVISRL